MTVEMTINVNTHSRSVVPVRRTPYFKRFTNRGPLHVPPTLVASPPRVGMT